MSDLLFEIGTEEIPAGFLQPAFKQLKDLFVEKAASLKIGHGDVQCTGTPRRLCLVVTDIAEKQEDIREELLGPSRKAAFDTEGNPTRAAMGFAGSKGAKVEDLKIVDTPKGEYAMLFREVTGQETFSLLPDVLRSLILDLSFPKSMKWGENHQSFARPIQWLTALFDGKVISFSHEGITSSNTTGGHRFHANSRFEVTGVQDYFSKLKQAKVVVDLQERRSLVIKEIEAAVARSEKLAGGKVFIDENLVDTVTNLVESPVGVCGTFDEKFLQLPPEVLITSMREHQKYFPVVDDDGQLLPGFVAVNNTKVSDPEVTRKGHQRVLRARLEDALFFFKQDKERSLDSRAADLTGIIFQAKLGTMAEKKERMIALVRFLAEKIVPEQIDDCVRAAELCKADLLTDMVGEFPSLQGTMGAAYAKKDGMNDSVALAIREHYMPLRAGAELPTSDIGALVGLADRFDTLAGCFGIGAIPSGTADPFGLRRITLAILHIIHGKTYPLNLAEIFSKALALYGAKVDGSLETVGKIMQFVKGRFANDCIRNGMSAEAVEAIVSIQFDDINDCLARIASVIKIKNEDAFPVLAGSFKRVRNIVKDNKGIEIHPHLFEDEAEKKLYEQFVSVEKEVVSFVEKRAYTDALLVMLRLKEPIDTFFDEVMVMAEKQEVRQNRLNLLTAFAELVLKVGDISKFKSS